MAMTFEQIVDAIEKEYAQHVAVNRYSVYANIVFGKHTSDESVGMIADRFKKKFKEGGVDAVYGHAVRVMQTNTSIWENILTSEFYSRVKAIAKKEGIVMPELAAKVDKNIDYRTALAAEKMQEPGPGWGLES